MLSTWLTAGTLGPPGHRLWTSWGSRGIKVARNFPQGKVEGAPLLSSGNRIWRPGIPVVKGADATGIPAAQVTHGKADSEKARERARGWGQTQRGRPPQNTEGSRPRPWGLSRPASKRCTLESLEHVQTSTAMGTTGKFQNTRRKLPQRHGGRTAEGKAKLRSWSKTTIPSMHYGASSLVRCMLGTVVLRHSQGKALRGIFNLSRVSLYWEALSNRKLTAKSRSGIIPNVTPRVDTKKVANSLPWLPLPLGTE